MSKPDTIIRTKLRLPFTRPQLVPRPRLQERIAEGLCRPLTLITAPAGFGKTTLVASCITDCSMPLAWLSLDRDDNQKGRFLRYLIAALQEVDPAAVGEAARLMAAPQQPPSEAVLTSLVNGLDGKGSDVALVLDDYQFIRNRAVHDEVAFLLDHCPSRFHLVIATRSDPPLPLARLRARGQMVELRSADLGFTKPEAAQFLNDVMGLCLDAAAVSTLDERTEGWIAGLQMAALSMRDRQDVAEFIEGFSGTNRFILDYLLEEVLANQSPEVQRFLLYTSILERLAAPLCDAVIGGQETVDAPDQRIDAAIRLPAAPVPDAAYSASQLMLEYLERANLFLVPLDEERIWYRYHHLFADLLRAQLYKSLGVQGVAGLHARASEWHAQDGSILEAIHHASTASDEARVERLIEQHYMEMVVRGEMSGMRLWKGKLDRDLVHNRPWLCIYEAYSHAWFGELDEAEVLLEEAENRTRSEISAADALARMAHLAYVKSRVTAMRGDLPRAIELCLEAREHIPEGNLALEFDTRVTLGYEFFLDGNYADAEQVLTETIRFGVTEGAIIHTVSAACILARLYSVQGLLNKSYDTYTAAAQLIPKDNEQHLDASALIEAGLAEVLCERNDLEAALAHVEQGLALLAWWGKPDDLVLAYITLARIRLAQAKQSEALEAVEQAIEIVQRKSVFPEARRAAEVAQVKLWLAPGDLQAASRWVGSLETRLPSGDQSRFERELAYISRARVLVAQKEAGQAKRLLSALEVGARSAGRMGRVLEILLLEALALQEMGDGEQAVLALTKCLALAEPEGYVRLFLEEGRPMQMLLTQWQAHSSAGRLRDYANHLLSHFVEPQGVRAGQEEALPADDRPASTGQSLIEPLSPRELEVLALMALGMTNREIARQLIVAPGTVKAHTASIYRKLDVSNRTEAAARARQCGILPQD